MTQKGKGHFCYLFHCIEKLYLEKTAIYLSSYCPSVIRRLTKHFSGIRIYTEFLSKKKVGNKGRQKSDFWFRFRGALKKKRRNQDQCQAYKADCTE